MRLSLRLAGLLLTIPIYLFAQSPRATSTARPATGSVTGHVTCSDTRQPARLASVVLQPVVTPDVLPGAKSAPTANPSQPTQTAPVQTQMDGSFTISGVIPGDYYVVAELPGYISPLSVFSRDELNHPAKEMADMMAQLMTPVTVAANSTARADVSLVKGATITGRVRFEDGMPETNSRVVLMRRDAKGKMNNYYPTTLGAHVINTDDEGRFRFAGLPKGEYKLFGVIAVQEPPVNDGPDARYMGANNSNASWLNVYYGNVFRRGDSKSINITGGEVSSGDDIELQLSKLHSVSGSVVDASTGAAVNTATVQIVWAGDAQYIGDSQISKGTVGSDGTFHFAFVPEGNYKLVVTDAHMVTQEQEPLQLPADAPFQIVLRPGSTEMPTRTVEKTKQTYGETSVPLIVHSDVSGVTVQLAPKPAVVAAQ